MTTLARNQPDWLTTLRAQGAAQFERTGLPTQRQEAWKYTGLNRLKDLAFAPTAPSPSRLRGSLPLPAGARVIPSPSPQRGEGRGEGVSEQHRLVFIDGHFDATQSTLSHLPSGVILGSLAALLQTHAGQIEPLLGKQALAARKPLAALNTAWIEDGLVLIAPRNVTIDAPVEVVMIASDDAARAMHSRHIVSLGENAGAVLIESHIGGCEGGFANSVMEITLGAGANLRHYIAHTEQDASFAVDTVSAEVDRDASYRSFALTAGGALVRREVEVALTQPGASAHIDGAYLVNGDRHADTTILIDHQAPYCSSRQTQKGVVGDHGRAVFQGKILVRPDAQKTDGYQLSQTLLLSPQAEIDVKPELEIHADDVKCSHGATVGRLDEDALFFLRARGIPERAARSLLIEGFIGGALDEIDRAAIRDAFGAIASDWLTQRANLGGSS